MEGRTYSTAHFPMRETEKKDYRLADSGKIQEVFLNHCRRNRLNVRLKGKDGQCEGKIIGYDRQTIILEKEQKQMLFYKSSLHSIEPLSKVNFIFNEPFQLENDKERHYDRSFNRSFSRI